MTIKHLTILHMKVADRQGGFSEQYNIDTCFGDNPAATENHHNFMVAVDSELGEVFRELAGILGEHVDKGLGPAKVE